MKKYLQILFLVFSLIVFQISCKNQVSIDEITADNVFQKLGTTTDSFDLHEIGLAGFKPWWVYTGLSPVGREETEAFEVDLKNFKPNLFSRIILTDKSTGVPFSFIVRGNYFKDITVNSLLNKKTFSDEAMPYGEDLITFLLREKEYIFKESNLKGGTDLLIKKKDNGNFLLCRIGRNDQGAPSTFYFEVGTPK